VSDWLRSLVMLTALCGWAAALIATLATGQVPDPILLGVPGGLYVAMFPPPMPWQRSGGVQGGPPPGGGRAAPADDGEAR